MKATEFVKKYGIGVAKVLLVESIGCGLYVDANYRVTIYLHDEPRKSDDIDFIVQRYDLEGIVESHDLVAIHGLEKSKEIVLNAPSDDHYYSWVLGGSGVRDKTVLIGLLKQAITDVEACQ